VGDERRNCANPSSKFIAFRLSSTDVSLRRFSDQPSLREATEVLLKHVLLPQTEQLWRVGKVAIDQRADHHLLQPSFLGEELYDARLPLSEDIEVGLEPLLEAIVDDAHVGGHDHAGLQVAHAADRVLELGDVRIGMAVPGTEGGKVYVEGEEDRLPGLEEAVGVSGMARTMEGQQFHRAEAKAMAVLIMVGGQRVAKARGFPYILSPSLGHDFGSGELLRHLLYAPAVVEALARNQQG